jgi:hypothetical protein
MIILPTMVLLGSGAGSGLRQTAQGIRLVSRFEHDILSLGDIGSVHR